MVAPVRHPDTESRAAVPGRPVPRLPATRTARVSRDHLVEALRHQGPDDLAATLLPLSRHAGNRAVCNQLIQREPPKTRPEVPVDPRTFQAEDSWDPTTRTYRRSDWFVSGGDKSGRLPDRTETYWAEFKVNEHGVMQVSARTVSADGKVRSGRLRLGDEFNNALARFKAAKIDVKAFDAEWSHMSDTEVSTNLQKFNQHLADNPKASRAEAARATPSGKIAARLGFKEVSVSATTMEKDPDIGSGTYPKVRARFSKPGTGVLPGDPGVKSGGTVTGGKGTPTPPTASKDGGTTTTTTKQRVKAGAGLAILGVNIGANMVIDALNAKRMQADLTRNEPAMQQAQDQDPTLGFLLVFYFEGGVDSGEGATASGRYVRMGWRQGYTESEATDSWRKEPRHLQRGDTQAFQWIPPKQAPPPEVMYAPFRKVAVAKFADIANIRFQKVSFAEIGGFDEKGQDEKVDATRWKTIADDYRFIVMEMPSSVPYRDVAGHRDTMSVPLSARRTRGGDVPVILLDDDTPAVAVWPVGENVQKLFSLMRPINDKEGRLMITNIRFVRWLRPEQVEVVQSLDRGT